MRIWVALAVIGLLLGVGLVLLTHHAGVPLAPAHDFAHGANLAVVPGAAPAISQTMKIGAIVLGLLLAFVPNDAVRKIAVVLSSAGIGALFAT